MRKVIIAAIACLLISRSALATENRQLSPETMEQIIVRLLFDSVHDAIEDYYGEPRQHWRDKLLSVRIMPDTPYDEVVIQVETFCGPHNPPYGIETMTFYVNAREIVLKAFEHQDAT